MEKVEVRIQSVESQFQNINSELKDEIRVSEVKHLSALEESKKVNDTCIGIINDKFENVTKDTKQIDSTTQSNIKELHQDISHVKKLVNQIEEGVDTKTLLRPNYNSV